MQNLPRAEAEAQNPPTYFRERPVRATLLPAGALSPAQFAFEAERGGADVACLVRLSLEQAGRADRDPQLIAVAEFARMYEKTPQ